MIRLLLTSFGYILATAAALAALAGAWYIYAGANPPPGGGSLGHVGMVIAGIILLAAAALLGPLGWLLAHKAASSPTEADTPAPNAS